MFDHNFVNIQHFDIKQHGKKLCRLWVDFTNVFRARYLRRFSYKCVFSSYVLIRAWKTHAKNVGEFDPMYSIILLAKIKPSKKLFIKCWWNWLKVNEEDFYNHQPTTRFEHFTKGPSLKFMDHTQSPSHYPASTTTASSTTSTVSSTTSAATVSPTTASASTTVEATTTSSLTRRSGILYSLSLNFTNAES